MKLEDFRRVFEAAPTAQLLLRTDLTICAVSEVYLLTTGTRREDVVGRGLLEVLSARRVCNATEVRASLLSVLRDRCPSALRIRYADASPQDGGEAGEERYWSIVNTPLLDDAGEVALILHTAEDATELAVLERQKLDIGRDLSRASERSARVVELLDAAPDATVIVSEDGCIEIVNRQTENLFGYPREELIGQPLTLLVPERFRQGHGAHVERFFRTPTVRPMGSGLALFGRRKDGSELPIEVSLSPHVREGRRFVSASIRDISERKQLEAAARLNADRLTSAVDAMQDAFALFDGEDRLVLCNSAYRKLMHADESAPLVGRPFVLLFDAWTREMEFEDEAARVRFRELHVEQRRRGPTSAFDVRLRDGRRMRVVDRHTPEGGIVKTIWDLTAEELRAEELREARAAAEAASDAKSEFLASMSHELRTPMNAILGFAQLLQRDRREPLSDRHKERVGHILSSGGHLLRLIDDVLDLARIEAGRISVYTEAIPIESVLEEVRKTLEPLAARYEVNMVVEPSEAASALLAVDRTRFAQILINFGSNAIKYNRRGGQVAFRCTRRGRNFARITVVDDGLGIPLDKQAKLFQPFQRAGQETGPIEGTGIGLVITRRLAALMGGDVGFESEPDVGSQFWVEMPLKQSGDPKAELRSEPIVSLPPLSTSEARLVLYVEDNPANVSFMRDLVGTFDGVDLLTVTNAEEGIELARVHGPAAILMDINLPGMSGVQALKVLREDAQTKHIPVIALTAAASEHDRALGLQAGFFRYLTKPVRVDELVAALEQVFSVTS